VSIVVILNFFFADFLVNLAGFRTLFQISCANVKRFYGDFEVIVS